MTAYVLGRRLGAILEGGFIESVRAYPGLLAFSLSGAPFPLMNVFRLDRRSGILFSDSPLASRSNSIPIFKQAWGGRINGVESLGIDRVILLKSGGEVGWEKSNPYIFRIDFITPGVPVTLFGGDDSRLITVSGNISGRDSITPRTTPESAPFSLLVLPSEPPPELAGEDGRIPSPAGRALPRLVEGLDPAAAEAVSAHFGGDPGTVWKYLGNLAGRLESAGEQWRLYRHGGRTVIYPVSLPFDEEPLRKGEYNEVMRCHAEKTVIPGFLGKLREMARSNIRRRSSKLKRLIKNLRRDYRQAEKYGEYLRYGNLLTSHFNSLKKGMKEVTLEDLHTHQKVTIPLKQKLTPQENIKRYFKKAKKGEAGMGKIGKRIKKAEKELERLSDTMEMIENSDSPDQLYLYIEKRTGQEDEGEGSGREEFRKYTIESKYTVYVGRNARENDRLTHAFASGRDLWFHARGVPGSHVVLRGANPSTPPRILKKVAAIAAYFSKSRNSELVPVSYTEKRYVRKPRKSPPGTARLERESTLFVSPSLPDDKSS